jgi:MtN3 and saliva related transmembrane protein
MTVARQDLPQRRQAGWTRHRRKGQHPRFQPAAARYIAVHASPSRKLRPVPASIDILGAVAALITSLCWLPQTLKILRERQTAGISLTTNAVFASGVVLWLVYGVLIESWPMIGANVVTLAFILAIMVMKLRFG